MKINTIILAVFVMIQVYETSGIVQGISEDLRTKREAVELDKLPHKYEPVKGDRHKFKKEFGHNVNCVQCSKPLPQVVTLQTDSETFEFQPKVVQVNRCLGSCSGAMACEPHNFIERKFAIKRILPKMTEEESYVSVVEHTDCGCVCQLKEKDCTKNMKYNKAACKCECQDEEKLMSECVKMGNTWNRAECTCNCKTGADHCITCEKFDPKTCRCVHNDELSYCNNIL